MPSTVEISQRKTANPPMSIRGLSEYAKLSKLLSDKVKAKQSSSKQLKLGSVGSSYAETPKEGSHTTDSLTSRSSNSESSGHYQECVSSDASAAGVRCINKLKSLFYSEDEDLDWEKDFSDTSSAESSTCNPSDGQDTDQSEEKIVPNRKHWEATHKIATVLTEQLESRLLSNCNSDSLPNLNVVMLAMDAVNMRVSSAYTVNSFNYVYF